MILTRRDPKSSDLVFPELQRKVNGGGSSEIKTRENDHPIGADERRRDEGGSRRIAGTMGGFEGQTQGLLRQNGFGLK